MIKNFVQSIAHPAELKAMIQLKLNSRSEEPQHRNAAIPETEAKRFSYQMLDRVSRSFAAVIQQLPPDLEDAICVFYLVLRGLDSVEDDMHLSLKEKQQKLINFHRHLDATTDYPGIGDTDDYRDLMAGFHHVGAFFEQLAHPYQMVIRDICERMGAGMNKFTERSVGSLEDYDEYCHYVAGLVGIGLTDLFMVSGYEDDALQQDMDLANSMGLFLQKTNITRDYREDLDEGRLFWPSAIWKEYASSIDRFAARPTDVKSIAALNHMVTDALRHLPDCIRYMRQLRCREVFRFCAIPQAMAIATLAKVYGNPEVFVRNVKIRKGLAARIMIELKDAESLWDLMDEQLYVLEEKARYSGIPVSSTFDHIRHAKQEMALARSMPQHMYAYQRIC